MKRNATMLMAVVAGLAVVAGAQEAGKIQLKIELPKPQFTGTPKDIRSPNLEPPRGGKPRPPIEVPVGADKVLSRDCKVTSSDPEPIIGELSFITDGDKEHDAATYVELGPGTQWVQIDRARRKRSTRHACGTITARRVCIAT